jgi:hypothetical protein
MKSSIAPVVNIVSLHDRESDVAYWLSQPPESRLAAIDELRRDYHGWEKGEEPKIQKVYNIVRRKPR